MSLQSVKHKNLLPRISSYLHEQVLFFYEILLFIFKNCLPKKCQFVDYDSPYMNIYITLKIKTKTGHELTKTFLSI